MHVNIFFSISVTKTVCLWEEHIFNAQRFFLEEEFNSVFVNVDIIPLVLNSEAHKI